MSQQTADVAWPVTDGTRVPFEIYTSQDVFDREQERIFRGPLWNYVALEAEIPAPGDFKTSFVGDTPVDVIRGHTQEIPPWPKDLAPALSGDLAQVLMKLLAKSPDQRYASAEELIRALDLIGPITSPVPPRRWSASESGRG